MKIAGFFTQHDVPSLDNIVSTLADESQLKKKDLYMILRIVLTGRKSGPPLKEIFQLIPNNIIIRRIEKYLTSARGL